MGKNGSKQKNAEKIPGLLAIKDLKPRDYDIENLVFSGGGAKDFSYPGAIKVLENLGILQGIKRFTGVGTGSIVAALLAVDCNCKSMQYLYNQLSDYLLIDSYIGYNNIPTQTSNLGSNEGGTFLDWFGKIFEAKSYESDLTFMQLYKRSGKELCIVLTNISKGCTEYCHPKTTPDLPIREAVFMSLTVPGIHCLKTYNTKDNVYVNGGLLCNYPIHSFDGWLLSMNPEDSILNRLDVPSQYHTVDHVFETRNPKTLGFVLIDKYIESDYKELTDRLTIAGARTSIPNTGLGNYYNIAVRNRMLLEERFGELRQISLNLCKKASETKNDGEIICEETLVKSFLDNSIIPSENIPPLVDESFENCLAYLKRLENKDTKLCAEWLEHVFKKIILSMLEEISDFYMTNTNSLHLYLGTVVEIMQSTMILKKGDFNRTIGIPCGHIVGNNDLEDEDKIFLYRQGWNATVAYLKQMHIV